MFSVQIADALNAAHRAGVVHGDLKPGNVMISGTGVKLLDFGLARQTMTPGAGQSRDGSTRTAPLGTPGAVLGTLQYLAPEQLEGREADVRSDIFACGAVVYEMVTGRKAFGGDTSAAVIGAIMRQPPPVVAAVQPLASPALDHAVATCLAKNPDDRWQNAGDLMRELTWIAGAGSAPAPAVSPRRTSGVWRAAAVSILAVALLVAVAVMYLLRAEPDSPAYRMSINLPEGLRFPLPGPLGGVGRFAISPDGRRIAFVATDPGGNQRLWVRSLESLIAQPLTGTDGAFSPFWSPDSQRIAFIAQGQLRTIDPADGSPAVVASPAFNTTGAWSSDNTIFFTPTAASPIHRVAASGGPSTPVTTLDRTAGEVLHRNPILLPDARHVLYTSVVQREGEGTGARGIYVAALDRSETPRVLIPGGTTVRYAPEHVIFLRANALLAQALDLDTLALTGEPRPLAEQVELIGPASTAFSVSDTGVLVYQAASGQGSRLKWVDRDGREVGTVGDEADYGDLELAPDGGRVAVSVLDPTLNTRDLWVVDLARGVRTRFTVDDADDVAPIWSPDGSRIVFASNRRGHFDLFHKPASGVGTEEMLLGSNTEKYPTGWFVGGSALMYWQYDADGTSLSTLPLAGEPHSREFLGGVSQGRFSPDGRWVLYDSAESGRSEVYVVPFPNASRRWQVSVAGGALSRWRADGQEIFYLARDNKLMAATVAVRGNELTVSAAQPLFEARRVGPRGFYAPSVNGQRFLINTIGGAAGTSITVLQNWRAAATP
jgi:eukaryotic-like serine/threonine-protein kinase